MKNYKKIIGFGILASSIFVLGACANNQTDAESKDKVVQESNTLSKKQQEKKQQALNAVISKYSNLIENLHTIYIPGELIGTSQDYQTVNILHEKENFLQEINDDIKEIDKIDVSNFTKKEKELYNTLKSLKEKEKELFEFISNEFEVSEKSKEEYVVQASDKQINTYDKMRNEIINSIEAIKKDLFASAILMVNPAYSEKQVKEYMEFSKFSNDLRNLVSGIEGNIANEDSFDENSFKEDVAALTKIKQEILAEKTDNAFITKLQDSITQIHEDKWVELVDKGEKETIQEDFVKVYKLLDELSPMENEEFDESKYYNLLLTTQLYNQFDDFFVIKE